MTWNVPLPGVESQHVAPDAIEPWEAAPTPQTPDHPGKPPIPPRPPERPVPAPKPPKPPMPPMPAEVPLDARGDMLEVEKALLVIDGFTSEVAQPRPGIWTVVDEEYTGRQLVALANSLLRGGNLPSRASRGVTPKSNGEIGHKVFASSGRERIARHDTTMRRFGARSGTKAGVVLEQDHAAVVGMRSAWPHMVVSPETADRIVINGHNNRKIGRQSRAGRWSSRGLYQVSLEERATCPTSCHHWLSCYGNNMPRARRHRVGPELLAKIEREIDQTLYRGKHSNIGAAVRLHGLGDFYSVEYVEFWLDLIDRYRGRARFTVEYPLVVWGYTARHPIEDPIGVRIAEAVKTRWSNFAIRFSNGPAGLGLPLAPTLPSGTTAPKAGGVYTCPEQIGKTDCCGTCGICWAGDQNPAVEAVGFVEY